MFYNLRSGAIQNDRELFYDGERPNMFLFPFIFSYNISKRSRSFLMSKVKVGQGQEECPCYNPLVMFGGYLTLMTPGMGLYTCEH